MSRKRERREGKSAIEIIEEATHLLRQDSGKALALYYLGSASFVLGFLYFWADMTRGAEAHKHIVEAALSVCLLFIWMKCWQTFFCRALLARIGAGSQERWSLRRLFRMIVAQTSLQPTGFILLPIALLITIPFGWVFAYYQNITVLGDGTADVKAVHIQARQQASLFPKQNHLVLLIIFLFSFFVFLNIGALLYLAPQLLQMLLGIETMFTRARWHLLNTTFLAITAAATYLVIDPLVKTVYVLRCYYGSSLRTGADLKSDLTAIRSSQRTGLVSLILLICVSVSLLVTPLASTGAEPYHPQGHESHQAISASELAESISSVISKREYSWRMPREKSETKEEPGPVGAFLDGVFSTLERWMKPIGKWISNALDWIIENVLKRLIPDQAGSPPDRGWSLSIPLLLYILGGVTASVLAILFLRMWQRRRKAAPARVGETVPIFPDLTKNEVAADELPMNKWLELGQELMKQGNSRLALRAFFLASLSHLAEHKRIVIAPFKSNREYEQELSRKAHGVADLFSAFSENRRLFEQVWYGMHDVTSDIMHIFSDNQKRIMADAEHA